MLRKFITFSGITMISRVFGYARDILTARLLGIGILNDLFIVSFRLPNFFRLLLAEGAVNSAFIPIYSKLKGNSKNDFIFSVFITLLVLSIVLSLLLCIFMPSVLSAITPGLSEDNMAFAVSLCRITIFYTLFIGLSVFFCSLLNVKNKFAPMAFLPVIMNVSLIVALFSFIYLGANLYITSISVILAGVMQLIFSYCIAKNHYDDLLSGKLDMALVKRFFARMTPIFINGGIYQLFSLVRQALGSFFIGGISYLYYVDRITQLPIALIGVSLSSVLLPNISRDVKNYKQIDKCIILALHLAAPAVIGCYYLSYEIINGLFGYGNFTKLNVLETAVLLQIFSFSIMANVFVKILSSIFFANDNTKVPLYSAIVSFTIFFLSAVTLMRFGGIKGIIYGSVIADFSQVAILAVLSYKNKYIKFKGLYFYHFFLAIIFSSIMIISIIVLEKFLSFYSIVNLLIYCAVGVITYVSLQFYFNKEIFYE